MRFFLLFGLLIAGCTLLPERPPAPPPVPVVNLPPPPVQPEDVTPANADQMADALQAELERDLASELPGEQGVSAP